MVVRSTIELAKSLNIVTVVEGVDSNDLFKAVIEVGSAGVQGSALAPAMTADALRAWLAQLAPRPSSGRTWTRDTPQPVSRH